VKIKRREDLLLLISMVLLRILVLKMDLKCRQTNVYIVVSLNISENNSHHRNIINQITSMYGRKIMDEICDMEKLRVKIKRRLALLLLISMVSL
jgi:hypothetical protein